MLSLLPDFSACKLPLDFSCFRSFPLLYAIGAPYEYPVNRNPTMQFFSLYDSIAFCIAF